MKQRIDLAGLARASGVNSKRVKIKPIRPPATLSGELARILATVPNEWAAARPAIMAEYERALSQLQTDSALDVGNVIDATSATLTRLILNIVPRLRDWTVRVESWHRDKWRGAVLTAARVDLGTMLTRGGVQETLDTALARNVALVRDISSQARTRIANAVFQGLTKRTPARDVAREISTATGLARARALRIASDQTVKLTSALDQERMKEVGIERYVWNHSGKAHPREDHLERDGTEYDWGAVEDEPGELPFCGCVAGAILDLTD